MVPTWLEPVPGWTDNINGPVGILIAAGKGVLRTMYCKADNYGDFLPVDIAANALCVATWNYLVNKYGIKFLFLPRMITHCLRKFHFQGCLSKILPFHQFFRD